VSHIVQKSSSPDFLLGHYSSFQLSNTIGKYFCSFYQFLIIAFLPDKVFLFLCAQLSSGFKVEILVSTEPLKGKNLSSNYKLAIFYIKRIS
jgi:hypothetical protein